MDFVVLGFVFSKPSQEIGLASVSEMVTGQLADTPTRGLDKSRTGQLAVSQMPPKRKTKHAKSPMASASCPVTSEMTYLLSSGT